MTTPSSTKKLANILYLDDEFYNLTAFNAAFRKYYHIYTTASAHEAMDILRKNKIDLVITDQRMPEISGVQFLEAMIKEFPEPIRMILTGFTDVEAIKKAINNGCVLRYITKPWDENELKQIIDMGVKIKELERNQQSLITQLEETVVKNKKLLDFFQQHVPQDLLKQVIELEKEVLFPTTAESKIISCLFVHISNFNKLTEKTDPQTVVSFLNNYFSKTMNCVHNHKGYIYKLMGEGLLATFGTLISTKHNQKNAIDCALDITEELKKLKPPLGDEIIITITINTGPAIIGHISSGHILSDFVMGELIDDVIKIKDLSPPSHHIILIDEATYQILKNDVTAEMLVDKNSDYGKYYKIIAKKANAAPIDQPGSENEK